MRNYTFSWKHYFVKRYLVQLNFPSIHESTFSWYLVKFSMIYRRGSFAKDRILWRPSGFWWIRSASNYLYLEKNLGRLGLVVLRNGIASLLLFMFLFLNAWEGLLLVSWADLHCLFVVLMVIILLLLSHLKCQIVFVLQSNSVVKFFFVFLGENLFLELC